MLSLIISKQLQTIPRIKCLWYHWSEEQFRDKQIFLKYQVTLVYEMWVPTILNCLMTINKAESKLLIKSYRIICN
jgi:hypothetical protein